jgi:dCMP deaminase
MLEEQKMTMENIVYASGGAVAPNTLNLLIGERLPHIPKSLDDALRVNADRHLLNKILKFLPDARAAAGRSKDRSTKVGAVVIDSDFNIRISGYNGFPRGVNDDITARHERPAKYDWTAHSEENCVAQAARIGVALNGCTLLLTALFPCPGCSRMIIQAGIRRVVAPRTNQAGVGAGRIDWDAKAQLALEMLVEAGVQIIFYDPEAV